MSADRESVAASPATSRALPRALSFPRVRLGIVPALALLVGVSTVFRVAAGWLRATPTYLPDEYMYAELARSIATNGRPLIRGVEAAFPSLLQPLVTAPLWLFEDTEISFRIVQVFGALAMSLAAPIAYLLARNLGLGRGLAFGVAVVTVAIPDLLYTGWILAEPLAYPIVLAAVAAGVGAIAAPTRRRQLAFAALAVLAVFARSQFVILPVCFVLAAAFVGWREGRLRAVLREQRFLLALFGLPVLAVAVVGRERLLGIYSAPFGDKGFPLRSFLPDLGPDLLMLAYASGWILVPGALIGISLALFRPRSREEQAFGALTALVTGGLLLEAGIFGEPDVVQERYVFYVIPLIAIGFALYASRGWPYRKAHAALVGGLLAASARFPLSAYYTADGKEHAPTLIGVSRFELIFGSPSRASVAVAVLAAVLCAGALAASFRPRIGSPAVLAVAAAVCFAGWIGAVDWDVRNSGNVKAGQLPADPTFVDDADVGPVAELLGVGAQRINTVHAFWNRSIERVLLLPDAGRLDAFTHERVRIAADGTLHVGGEEVRQALLVDEFATTMRFRDAEAVSRIGINTLWRMNGRAQLSMSMFGRYFDGWLATQGDIDLWPKDGGRLEGTLRLRLRVPKEVGHVTLTFQLSDGQRRRIELVEGPETVVELPVCSTGRWNAHFKADRAAYLEGRILSGSVEMPVFTPSRSACGSSA